MGALRDIVFVCGARDFHAMDKYSLTVEAVYPRKVIILTDLIESEGQPKIVSDNTPISRLYIIDRLLFKKQSSIANLWRNFIKMIFIPVQVAYLKSFYEKHPNHIYHAIPMYYMLLCYLAKIPFVATPQGSEILVRPLKSRIYKKYAIASLKAAKKVIVDSVNMQKKVYELSSKHAIIIKNGFDTSKILNTPTSERKIILSMRGLNPIYRIEEILKGRLLSNLHHPMSFVYPASEEDYRIQLKKNFEPGDEDLGRLDKEALYKIMANTLLAISIPISDSSPRSVYECIFAGACVAVTYSPYFDELPSCMKERVYLVDVSDNNWFDKAVSFARRTTITPFVPSQDALDMCDQNRTIHKVINEVYN